MPVFSNKIIDDQIHILIWQITESENDWAMLLGDLEIGEVNEITNYQKKCEYFASRLSIDILAQKLGINYTKLSKNEDGKPFIDHPDWEISISHSKDFVAVGFRKYHAFGIDIERPSQKIMRVLPRLFSESETKAVGTDIQLASIYWSAKEALYKLYGKRKVDFKLNMFLNTVNQQLMGSVKMPDYDASHKIYYESISDYILVIAY